MQVPREYILAACGSALIRVTDSTAWPRKRRLLLHDVEGRRGNTILFHSFVSVCNLARICNILRVSSSESSALTVIHKSMH